MGKTRILKLSTHVRYLKRLLKWLRKGNRDTCHPVLLAQLDKQAELVEQAIKNYEIYFIDNRDKYYVEIDIDNNIPITLHVVEVKKVVTYKKLPMRRMCDIKKSY